MFGWAVEHRLMRLNPAREVRKIRYATSGFHTWTVGEVRQFEERHPIGTKARLALLLHWSAHGLRKAGATIAAERGATDRLLMALYDWETAAQANVYTAAADRRQLAGEAARLLAGDQNENKECPTELPHLGNLLIFQNDNEGDGGSDGTRTRDLRRDRPTL
jgi:hypothetical protein